MEERTGWQGRNENEIVGEEKRNGRLDGAAETSKERAEWRRLQRKNLLTFIEHTGPAEKERVGLSATKRTVGKYAEAALCQ